MEKQIKEYTFKPVIRLIEMLEPSDKAKKYIENLANIYESEGYLADAKVVRTVLRVWDGKDVPMATQDKSEKTLTVQDVMEQLKRFGRSPEVIYKKSEYKKN